MAQNLIERFNEQVLRYSPKTVIIYRENDKWISLSFNSLGERVELLAKFLLKEGISKGDRVAILLDNRPLWPAIFFAIVSRGGIVVPINPESSREEVENIIKDSECKVLFVTEHSFLLKEEGYRKYPFVKAIVSADSDDLEVKLASCKDIEVTNVELDREALACILYTSGTTDIPKGVMLTHGNLLSNCESMNELGLISSTDRVFSILPLHHAYSLTGTMLLPILSGGTIVNPGTLRGELILKALEETKTTVFIAVPQIFNAFYKKIIDEIKKIPFPFNLAFNIVIGFLYAVRKKTGINIARHLLSGIHNKFGRPLRFFVSGGARLEKNIANLFFKLGFTILEGYGLTETAPVLTINPLNKPKIGSVGKAIPKVRIKIAEKNEEGVGEVIAYGPNIMKGYYKRSDLTSYVIKDGWFHTGDLGYIDDEGYLFLTGRIKDVIVLSSGKNVYPEEVENAYSKQAPVKEMCVFEVPIKKGKEEDLKLWAIVVPDLEFFRRVDTVNLKEVLKERFDNVSRALPSHMRLMGFFITLDELPRTLLGKIKRFVVKETYLPRIIGEEEIAPEIKELSEEDKKLMGLETTRKVIDCLEKEARIKRRIVPGDLLELDLGIDSLGRIELASNLEKAFGMKIKDEAIGKVFTVRDLIIGIEGSLKEMESLPLKGKGITFGSGKTWHALLEVLPKEENLNRIDLAPGLGAAFFSFFSSGLIYLIFKIFYSLKIEGKINIPKKGPYILYVNHTSYFDGFLVTASLPYFAKLDLFFVGFRVYFDIPFIRRLIRIGRIIPLDFSSHFLEALRSSYYVLKRGKNLCLFPEGMRTLTGEVSEFKKGFGILAKETGALLVPVLIKGAYEAWPRTARFPKRHTIKVRIGKTISCEEIEIEGYKLGGKDSYAAICLGAKKVLIALERR